MNELILTIDQGTSGTKSVLFDQKAQIISRWNVESKSYFPQPGFVEQDPLELFENTLTSVNYCIYQAAKDNPNVVSQIRAVGISNQRETLCYGTKRVNHCVTPSSGNANAPFRFVKG